MFRILRAWVMCTVLWPWNFRKQIVFGQTRDWRSFWLTHNMQKLRTIRWHVFIAKNPDEIWSYFHRFIIFLNFFLFPRVLDPERLFVSGVSALCPSFPNLCLQVQILFSHIPKLLSRFWISLHISLHFVSSFISCLFRQVRFYLFISVNFNLFLWVWAPCLFFLCRGHFKIAILPQFLAIELHFVRKGCRGTLKISIVYRSFWRSNLISWKGCRGHFEIAILLQFLAIEPRFVRKGCDRHFNFTSVFGDRTSFRAKGLPPRL